MIAAFSSGKVKALARQIEQQRVSLLAHGSLLIGIELCQARQAQRGDFVVAPSYTRMLWRPGAATTLDKCSDSSSRGSDRCVIACP
ncbi:MAG: hypothetical protein ACR2IP_11185 [Solirubrobacteraceae bacterium]